MQISIFKNKVSLTFLIPNLIWLILQNCKIYLSGNKFDLVDDDKKRRQVDYHSVTDYADGEKQFFFYFRG